MSYRLSPGRYWLGVGIVAVVLFVSMTARPGTGSLLSVRTPLISVDKWLHLVGYTVLAYLLGTALWASRIRHPAVRSLLGASLYGTILEGLQWFLAYRTFAVGDTLVNALGAGIGIGLWYVGLSLRTNETE